MEKLTSMVIVVGVAAEIGCCHLDCYSVGSWLQTAVAACWAVLLVARLGRKNCSFLNKSFVKFKLTFMAEGGEILTHINQPY